MQEQERVSITRCSPATEDKDIIQRTVETIQQLGDYGEGLRNARRIAIKINSGIHRIVLTEGRQTELTEPAVVEGAIRAIREVTNAEIVIGDAATDGGGEELYAALGYPERLSRYANVRLIDFNKSELVEVAMQHPDPMFQSYSIPRELAEADAFVSLAKMKAHQSLGCTLCIKNLFGWLPTAVYGSPRTYLHDRLIRLPRVLVDLAAWMKPCLNVVDGIVAANKSEWHGVALRPGVLLAGTNCVATDSVGARVMGFDPDGDYPDHPFFYRRNAIKLAAERGLGPNHSEAITVVGPSPEEVCVPFHVEKHDGETHRPEQIRRGAECVRRYQEQQDVLARDYAGRYLALNDGQVLWDGPDMQTMQRKEHESGRDWQTAPHFVVRCVPASEEIEQMHWYAAEAQYAAGLPATG